MAASPYIYLVGTLFNGWYSRGLFPARQANSSFR